MAGKVAQLAGVMVALLVLKGSFRVGQHGLWRSNGTRYRRVGDLFTLRLSGMHRVRSRGAEVSQYH